MSKTVQWLQAVKKLLKNERKGGSGSGSGVGVA